MLFTETEEKKYRPGIKVYKISNKENFNNKSKTPDTCLNKNKNKKNKSHIQAVWENKTIEGDNDFDKWKIKGKKYGVRYNKKIFIYICINLKIIFIFIFRECVKYLLNCYKK